MRECINGVAFILLFTLTIMISVFLWDTWATSGPANYQRWAGLPGVPTACVLFWVFGAEAYRTFSVWKTYVYGLHVHVIHIDDTLAQTTAGVGMFAATTMFDTISYLVAGTIFCLGLLRGIYIFTPPDWKGRVWIYASIFAAAFTSIPVIFHYY